MFYFFQSAKGFKESCLKLRSNYNSQSRPLAMQRVADASPNESFQASHSVCPVDQVLELSTSNTNTTCIVSEVPELSTNNTMPLKEGLVNILRDESPSFKGMIQIKLYLSQDYD